MTDMTEILLRAVLVIATIIALSRLHGLRSFSKLSGFDFAITVSIGSVLAGAVTTLGTKLWVFCAALAFLFAVQIIVSQLRVRTPAAQKLFDNAPIIVMQDGAMIPANMRKAGISESDLWAKLREANAYDLKQVKAVIMETTGDVSVLHGPQDGPEISDEILKDVLRK
jgi:uncharacterized membrane protein YcaP (DUF421 family)